MEAPQPAQPPAPPRAVDRLKNKWQRWKRAKILHITDEQTEEEKLLGKEWDQLGFHRPIGGVFYAIGFLPIVAVVGIMLLPLAQFTKLRFVEIGSFEAIAAGLFGAVYSILDFELGRGIQRFVPEYLIKDPRKATQFATFFIKYQMWTGLGQITLLSFVILYFLGNTNMAYLIYFLLFINIKQYPGQLGVFDSILDAHQQFSKQYMRTFYQIEIVQNITGPVFGIIGLFYGMSNPVMGELMGLALGYAIGTYVDDFLGFCIGGYYYSQILNKQFPGLRLRDVVFQKVDREVWTVALRYSLKYMPNTIFSSLMGFFGWSIRVNNIPGYVTWAALIKTGQDLTKFAGWGKEVLNKSPAGMAESYNNNKIMMFKYYVASAWKYNTLLFLLFFAVLAIGLPVVFDGIIAAGFLTEQWVGVKVVLPILLILQSYAFLDDTTDKTVSIGNHPEINVTLNIVTTIVDLAITYLVFIVWNLGWVGLVVGGLPSQAMRIIVRWIFVNKKMVRFDIKFWKGIYWQVFVAPLLAMGCFVGLIFFDVFVVYDFLQAAMGDGLIVISTAITLVLVIFMAFLIYLPLYAFFGGFDEYSLNVYKKAVALTGPSIIFTWPFYKLFAWGYRHSPFKRRAKITFSEEADKEVRELAHLRLEGRAKAAAKKA